MSQKEITNLKHINEIESPQNLGKKVAIKGIVASTSLPYSVPRLVTVTTKNGEEKPFEIEPDSRINLQFIGISDGLKYERLQDICRAKFPLEKIESARIEKERIVYWLKIRPQVFSLILVKKGDQEKAIDEEGFEYKAYDVFVSANSDHIKFQASTVIELTGVVVPHPKSQIITFLADEVRFPNEENAYDAGKVRNLKAKLDSIGSVDSKRKWVLDNFAAYAHIVNRSNVAFANFLCFFTPLRIRFDGNLIHGWGNILDIGDSTTAKSETARKQIQLLEAGTYITAETATNVGLVGAATQSDRGAWYVDWGSLVIEDRKLLVTDGAHKLTKSQWAALGEAQRQGMVSITKAAKSEAYARTREIVIANPLNHETWNTQTMDNFLHPVQAVSTILDVISIARLDLAIFVRTDEVDHRDVNRLSEGSYDRDLELLKEALRWCWYGKAEVSFTKDATEEIIESSNSLYESFHSDDVPLVSIDMRYKLARLSAALAFLTVSSDDLKTLIVTREHVRAVTAFIEAEYARSGLGIVAKQTKYEALDEKDVDDIIKRLKAQKGLEELPDEQLNGIFSELIHGTTRAIVKQKFELSENTQLRPLLSFLEGEELTKRTGRGIYGTRKLIQLYKIRSIAIKSNASNEPKKEGGENPEPPEMVKALGALEAETISYDTSNRGVSEPNDANETDHSAGTLGGGSIFGVVRDVRLDKNSDQALAASDTCCEPCNQSFATAEGKRHHAMEMH